MVPLARTLFSLFGIGPAGTDADLHEVADRRHLPRFKVELALQWPGGTAVVRNISSTGVRFETNHPISVHEDMKFILIIPDDEGQKSYYTLCDAEIHWAGPSPTVLHKRSVGASFTKIKSVEVPLAA